MDVLWDVNLWVGAGSEIIKLEVGGVKCRLCQNQKHSIKYETNL